MTGLRLRNPGDSSVTEDIEVTGAFIAIGHTPNTELFAGQLDQLVNDLLEAPEQHAQFEDRNVLVDSHDWEGIADAYFAHVTSVFSRSVYNRRQDKVSAYPE